VELTVFNGIPHLARTVITNTDKALEALRGLHLRMRTFHDVKKPDLAFTLWGERLSMPILSGATGGASYNMGGKMTEDDFIKPILNILWGPENF
jgi:isopentenyl diphosphate isomerase/L-lactate dehydrogenase-like FMN-dependent dehydrogenase